MKPIVFAITSYQYLLKDILKISVGQWEEGKVEIKSFPDGEQYHRFLTEVEGRQVFIIGGTINDTATLELFDMAQGLVQYGAYELHLLIPYFGYSTMERAVKEGEIVKAKTRAQLFSALPATPLGVTIALVDVHAAGIPYYFNENIRSTHLYAKESIKQIVEEIGYNHFVLAATDAGRAKWVESLANDLQVKSAFVYKKRTENNKLEVTAINAAVDGEHVIIYDDMIRTGGTLLQAAKAYNDCGAKSIAVITTHGVFTPGTMEKIAASGLIEQVHCLDTHPNALPIQHSLLHLHSVAPLLNNFMLNASHR